MIRTQVLSGIGDLEAIQSEWRGLLERSSSAEPVVTPTWALAWWKQFGVEDGRRLAFLTVREGEELVGVAPFCFRMIRHRRLLPVRRLELMMTGEDEKDEICSDYVGIVAKDGAEKPVAEAVARWIKTASWDELVMSAMNGSSSLVSELAGALEKESIASTLEPSGGCPHIPLPATWDAYLKQLESSKRYVVNRALRELEKWSGKEFELCRAKTAEELAAGRQILERLHGERWEDQGRSGVFTSSRFSAFHDDVMKKLFAGEDGKLDLLWLNVKGEPIAVIYNIVYRKKVYFYQSGRKVDVPKGVKPGIAIHALAIQRAIADGYREYDFLNGNSQYKKQLALATRPLVTLRAFAPNLRGQVIRHGITAIERAVTEVKRRVKRSETSAGETIGGGEMREGGEEKRAE